jgi:hypothetical protein
MPVWTGDGVVIPFPLLVVVGKEVVVVVGGIPKFCSTQYESPAMSLQELPTEGF